MKKLLILALTASIAAPAHAVVLRKNLGIKKAFVNAGTAIRNGFVDAGTEIKDATISFGQHVADITVDATTAIKNSDVGDWASQMASAPADVSEAIKDGFDATVDATKALGTKIADSRFAANIKKANTAIVDTTKKAATKVKDFTHDVAHSEGFEDAKDVFRQFGHAPKEAWINIAAFFTAIKSELVD